MLAHWALKRIKIQTQTNQTHIAAPARTWHTVEKDGPTRAPCGVFPTFMKQPSSIPPLSPRVHRTVVMNREQAGHPRVKPESGCGVHSSCAQSSHRFFLFVAVSIPTCLSGLTSPLRTPASGELTDSFITSRAFQSLCLCSGGSLLSTSWLQGSAFTGLCLLHKGLLDPSPPLNSQRTGSDLYVSGSCS